MATLQLSPVVPAVWAARFAQPGGYRNYYAESSVPLVEFAQQLLLQMSPRSLFYRATLGGYPSLLRFTFAPCSWFHRLRHVPDLRPARADVSLFWFCVRIHYDKEVFDFGVRGHVRAFKAATCRRSPNLALPVGDKNKRNRGVSRHNFIDRRFVVNK
jgi:hypothetical protein